MPPLIARMVQLEPLTLTPKLLFGATTEAPCRVNRLDAVMFDPKTPLAT